MILKKNKSELILLVILCVAILLGFYFRVKGLSYGGYSSSDEYYMAKSIHHILEYGLPKFPLGGYYDRGLIYQYLCALLLLTGLKEIFALRIIPLLFNLLALPAVYLLGKKIGGKLIAVSILILFCFSALEVEYARLARYYAPFQTIFIWYILFLYKLIIEGDYKSFKWMLILSIVSIFIYEGSIFLLVLNFLPFVLNKGKVNIKKIIYPSIIFIIGFFYLRFDFWHVGVTNSLPTNVSFANENNYAPVDFPHLFIQTFSNVYWFIIFLILVVICVLYGIYLFKNIREKKTALILLFFSVLSLFNLFGILILSFIIFYLINWINYKHLKRKSFYLLTGLLCINFLFYLIYGITSTSWLGFFPEESSISVNKIFWVLFNYPNFYQKIVLPWFYGLHFLTIFSYLMIGIYILIVFYKSWKINKERIFPASADQGNQFLLAVFIFLISIVAVLKTPYEDVRYTYFVYPLLLLLVIASIFNLGNFLFKNNYLSIL